MAGKIVQNLPTAIVASVADHVDSAFKHATWCWRPSNSGTVSRQKGSAMGQRSAKGQPG
jgi:hypothetical protein